MLHKRKILTLLSLTAFIILGMAAAKAPAQKERNLKILPKDISDEKLDSIMQTYRQSRLCVGYRANERKCKRNDADDN